MNLRDKMSRLLIRVFDLIEEQFRSSMLHDNMNISRLRVYVKQIEESRLRNKNIEAKRERTGNGNFSKGKFDGQGRPRFKQSFLTRRV